MALVTLFASFNIHISGASAEAAAKAKPVVESRGNTASGAAVFTDPNVDLENDFGITTNHKIEIIEGTDARDTTISAVSTNTVTVGGGNFSVSENNLLYIIYLPPTDTLIINNPSNRGTGSVGFQEWLAKIDALIDTNSSSSDSLSSNLLDLSYGENMSEQVIVFADGA